MLDDELQKRPDAPLQEKREPPVVTRLVVEIRSDGSRTIARGAIEDVPSGQRVEVNAEGATPLLLLGSLLRSLTDLPSLARRAAVLLLAGRGPKR